MYRWKGGIVALSGILKGSSDSGFIAADLPSFLDYITFVNDQRLYECRLLSAKVDVGKGRAEDSLLGVEIAYSFLGYKAGSAYDPIAFSVMDGTTSGSPSLLNSWIPSSGSRGYIDTSRGRISGYHLKSCAIKHSYQSYEAPSLPSIIPVYTNSTIEIIGLTDNPNLFMGITELDWLNLVVPGESGDVVDMGADNLILTGQTAAVRMLNNHPVMMSTMSFIGCVDTSTGSNNGDWYYSA